MLVVVGVGVLVYVWEDGRLRRFGDDDAVHEYSIFENDLVGENDECYDAE